MSVCDKPNGADRAALEKMSTQELKDLLCQMSDSRTATDGESAAMLQIMEILKTRNDNGDWIRTDVGAAMKIFREEYLPSTDVEPEEVACEREQPASGAVPAFLAAFAGGKKISAQEEDEIRRMIDDFRKEQ